jgi:CRISPR system Cascade subunit CasD
MPSDTCFLVLQLSGPLQSWGFDSRYTQRNTGLFPTKSAVAGMICAALGYSRGSQDEKVFLDHMRTCTLTTLSLVKYAGSEEKRWKIPTRRIEDFHTVLGTKSADGKNKKDAVLTQRQYLCDAEFLALLEGPTDLVTSIGEALKNPVWGIWLGRKACIPSKPVFGGVFDSLNQIEDTFLHGLSCDNFSQVSEVDAFDQGKDSIPDVAVSFDIQKRSYVSRRVKYHKGKKQD